MSLILKQRGFEVAEAATVAEALEALGRRPNWVLLDLMLPDGCGTEVLRRIKANGDACRVCVVTGCGPDKVEEARALGPDTVVHKPLNVERLLSLLTA